MRYARRVDKNQSEIVKALRSAGARVKVIHQPFDLQIWAENGKSMMIEIKNPDTAYGRKGLNAKQLEESQGLPVAMVDSVDAALGALNILKAG